MYAEKAAQDGQEPGREHTPAGQLLAEAAGTEHATGVGTGCKLTSMIHKSPAKLIAHTQLKNVSKQ